MNSEMPHSPTCTAHPFLYKTWRGPWARTKIFLYTLEQTGTTHLSRQASSFGLHSTLLWLVEKDL
jgi:hypothetical protein